MEQKLHVLLIDDDYQWTEELRKIFALEPSIKIAGTSDSMEDGLQKLEMLKPDVVMVSVELGDIGSFVQQARKIHPSALFMAQLSQNDQSLHQQSQSAGVHKVILKGAVTTGEIIHIIRQVVSQAQKPASMYSNPTPPPQIPSSSQPNPFGTPTPQPPPQQPYMTPPVYPYGTNPIPTYPPQGVPYVPTPSYPNGIPMAPSFEGMPPQGTPSPQVPMQQARIRTTVIAVNSSKGGVGKSSISKELASAFALAKIPTAPGMPPDRLKVCLVDMDLDYGNISAMLRLNPIPNIASWASDINERLKKGEDYKRILYTPEQFEPYLLTHHETGLRVLAAPVLPTEALQVNDQTVEVIVESLKAYFDVVILDTGNNTKDYTLVSLDKAQKVVIVTTPDVPTVRNIQSLLETLQTIHYPMEKLHLVVNEVSKRSEISVNDIVRTLDMTLLGVVPEDVKVRQANNNGEVLVLGRDTEFTNAIRKIGHQLVPVFSAKRKKTSAPKKKLDLFGFLKKH